MKILKKAIIVLAVLLLVLIIFCINIDNKSSIGKDIETSCNIETIEYDGRNIFVLTPKSEKKNDMIILYLHGGSYMGAMTNEHWDLYKDLINDLGCNIVAPDYPLTPKYNYKDTISMMETLYKQLIEKIDPSNFIVMGDSAGGGLSLALLEKVGEENIQMPNQTILISTQVDVRLNNPEIEEVEPNDPELNKSALKIAGENYAGKDGIDSYLVNPIDGPLDKLKNVSIFTGTNDILNPDIKILQERAKEVGTEINVYETEGATHVWLLYKYKDEKNDPLVQEPYKQMIELLKNNQLEAINEKKRKKRIDVEKIR